MRAQRVENGVLTVETTDRRQKTWSRADIDARGLTAVAAEIAQHVAREPGEVRIEVDGAGNIVNAKYGRFGEDE